MGAKEAVANAMPVKAKADNMDDGNIELVDSE